MEDRGFICQRLINPAALLPCRTAFVSSAVNDTMPTLRFWLLGTCRGASGGRTRNRRPVDLNTAPFTDLSRCSLRGGAKSSSPHAQIFSVPKGRNQGKAIGVRCHLRVWVGGAADTYSTPTCARRPRGIMHHRCDAPNVRRTSSRSA